MVDMRTRKKDEEARRLVSMVVDNTVLLKLLQ
jgi:hypothetical protein